MAEDDPTEDAEAAEPHTGESEEAEGGGPLGDLASDVSRRRSDREAEGDLFETAFDEVGVDDVEIEEVWAELGATELSSEADEDGGRDREQSDVQVQNKNVCHGCEHFSTPPEMRCNHDGTEIREITDTDHYEVVDCPMMVSEDFE